MTVDASLVAGIIADCAQKHLVPYFNSLQDDQIFQKDEKGDIVTKADIETEENLIRELKQHFPDAVYIGEESFDPNNKDSLSASSIFVIDPLDGTAAFRDGRHGFAILVAYIENGTLIQSWLHAPMLQQSVYAEKGKGVFVNGVPVELRTKPVTQYIGTGHLSAAHRPEMQEMANQLSLHDMKLAPHTHACMDFLNFIKGDVDYIVYQNCYPWDILSGVLMIHELGGYSALFYDEKDLMLNPFYDIWQPTLYTRSKDDWGAMKAILSAA